MERTAFHNYPVRRLAVVRLVFFVLIIIIVLRLGQLQIINYRFYNALASGQHELLAQLIPRRGEIFLHDPYSSTGVSPAAVNRNVWLLYAVPTKITNAKFTAETLAPLIKKEAIELELILNKINDPYEPLAHELNQELIDQILSLKLDGIHATPEPTRFYPENDTTGQLIGFIGYVNNNRQGQYGIEDAWEKELAGTKGILKSNRDAAGTSIALGVRELESAVDGKDLILTIDKNIQYHACKVLEKTIKKHKAKGGNVVIIDPKTGAILAMCGYPNFDSNKYAEINNSSYYLNNAVSTPYEPGSVFKAITMAAALESGKVTPQTTYTDTGEVRIGPDTIRNSDNKSHGTQTMTQVLEESLNTGAVFAMRQAGLKIFTETIKKFGFGQLTNIELPHEKGGNIVALTKKSEIYSATTSFGQGITTTPLQLAVSFAAIANQGQLMRPYIVSEITGNGKTVHYSSTLIAQPVSATTASTLSAMLVSVVERGHGKRAGVPGYYIAGKTGTAQVPLIGGVGYDKNKTIGTFVGFGPVDNPKFSMVVKIVEPQGIQFAESTAAPAFGEIAKFLLEYFQIPPERDFKQKL